MSEEHLLKLMDAVHEQYDIEYGGFLSNHYNHGLTALFTLDACKERIDKWFEHYKYHSIRGATLEPRPPVKQKVTMENWKEFLGEKTNFSGLDEFITSSFFGDEKHNNGDNDSQLTSVVEFCLSNGLFEGLSGAAFHMIIHLGYSLFMKKSNLFISEAVAYLIYSNRSLGKLEPYNVQPDDEVSNIKSFNSLLDVVTKVREDSRLNNLYGILPERFSKFQNRMIHIKTSGANEILMEYLSSWKPIDSQTLEDFNSGTLSMEKQRELIDNMSKQIAVLAVTALYGCYSDEFFLLHGVTACFSVIQVGKYLNLGQALELYRYFLLALLAAYVAEGTPDLSPNPKLSEKAKNMNWNEIIDEVINPNTTKNEEHAIKLVMVCKWFEDNGYTSILNELGLSTDLFKLCAAQLVSKDTISYRFDTGFSRMRGLVGLFK
mmetsp:Transcript_40384/g.86164  ORF Transcript_40384/g.86164 Transcript_40384/m.86164 type:complete len:432 (+) Transcript_40384:39-1334(+)